MAGARSVAAIAEWAADAPQPVRAALGARRDPLAGHWAIPSEATIRRTLGRLDAEALATAIGAWLSDRDPLDRRRRAVAVDGKTLRGARTAAGRQVHLLAAMDHTTRAVLTQRQVDGAPGRGSRLAAAAGRHEPGRGGGHADALHTHADTAEFLVTSKQAHDLFTVKANQPTLLDRCAALAWHNVPVADRTRDQAHGRVELRTLKAVTVNHVGFPHAAQVLQVTRKTRDLHTRRWRTVTIYAITSLTFAQARPTRLADLHPGALGDRERSALGPGRDLHRGRLSGPDRHRPAGHGLPAQPRHRRAQPGWAGQPGRRPAPQRPRPCPALTTLGITLG